jgi:hypothetical protein
MPADPNQGVVRTGAYPNKPTIEEGDNTLWITTDDDEDPTLVVSLYGCMSVLIARKDHIDEIEQAEREAAERNQREADEARLRDAGAMGAEVGPEYPEYPQRGGDEPTP